MEARGAVSSNWVMRAALPDASLGEDRRAIDQKRGLQDMVCRHHVVLRLRLGQRLAVGEAGLDIGARYPEIRP